MFLKKQFLSGGLLEKLDNIELPQEAYKILNTCIKNCGVVFEAPVDIEDYIPFKFVLNVRTGAKNTQLLFNGKSYFLMDENTNFNATARTLYDISCIATMKFIRDNYIGDLKNVLPHTDVIPLGVLYNNESLYLFSQLYIEDEVNVDNFKGVVESPINFSANEYSDVLEQALLSKRAYCVDRRL